MGLFDAIFGIEDKVNVGELIPDPPQRTLATGSLDQLLGGTQNLIDTFTRRSQGLDQFDFIKFLFEPQLNRLNQSFGRGFIGDEGEAGALGRRRGALGSLEADLQRRNLFDTGSSGVLQAILESDRAGKEAELFGEAKQLQRADIDQSLANLNLLQPQQFSQQNIPNNLNFLNQQDQFQAQVARNQALLTNQQRRTAQQSNAIFSGIGLGLAPVTGGASLALQGPRSGQGNGGSDFSGLGSIFGGGGTGGGGNAFTTPNFVDPQTRGALGAFGTSPLSLPSNVFTPRDVAPGLRRQ